MRTAIDISHHQKIIDYSGINCLDAVIMKLSQRQHKDVAFEENYKSITVPKGCYIYNKVGTVSDAKAEAEYAVKALNGRSMPCGVWLDAEASDLAAVGKQMITQILCAEADILEAEGYNVGIYCNKYWYCSILDSPYLVKRFPFWIARYAKDDNGTPKESLSTEKYDGCVMWQYSSKGRVDGITGNVDMDMVFKDLTTIWNKKTSPVPSEYYPKYEGNSNLIDCVLSAVGVDSAYIGSYKHRKPIASANGIDPYTGTAKQNMKLIDLAKAGKLRRV